MATQPPVPDTSPDSPVDPYVPSPVDPTPVEPSDPVTIPTPGTPFQ